MPSRDLPLSVNGVRSLLKDLKAFSRALGDDIKVDIEQAMCAAIAEDVRADIASIRDVDGNYLGTDNPNASVVVEVGLPGHDVIWRGRQIAYVEFGTGARGVGYPGPAMSEAGYHPDPTKKSWWYLDARLGGAVRSHGLPPHAPMYHAARVARMGGAAPARLVLRRAVDALALR